LFDFLISANIPPAINKAITDKPGNAGTSSIEIRTAEEILKIPTIFELKRNNAIIC
jgi:hypothetical protein